MRFSKTYTEEKVNEVSLELIDIFIHKFKESSDQDDKRNYLLIGLSGDLGAGKTTLTKAILRNLGVIENVISPTFVLRKDYDLPKSENAVFEKVIHIDAYRLERKENIGQVLDLNSISEKTLIIIEWAELAQVNYDLSFNIKHISGEERQISLI
jgi:tRNA threonylcarbamoyladenosine biosynthesis protein TsaE